MISLFIIVLVYVEWLEIIHFQFDGTNVQFYHYYLHYFHLQLQIAASNVSVVDIFECCQYCTLIVWHQPNTYTAIWASSHTWIKCADIIVEGAAAT